MATIIPAALIMRAPTELNVTNAHYYSTIILAALDIVRRITTFIKTAPICLAYSPNEIFYLTTSNYMRVISTFVRI